MIKKNNEQNEVENLMLRECQKLVEVQPWLEVQPPWLVDKKCIDLP